MPLSDEVNAIRNELAAVKTELLAQDASIKALQSAVESQKATLDELKTSIGAVDKQDDDRWALLKTRSSQVAIVVIAALAGGALGDEGRHAISSLVMALLGG